MRSAIAGCALLLFVSVGAADAQDALILFDGKRETGSLQRCDGAQCTVDTRTRRLPTIHWIALGSSTAKVPEEKGANTTRIYFRDGSIKTEKLLFVDATTVQTMKAAHPRKNVQWIHLEHGERTEIVRSTPPRPPVSSSKPVPGRLWIGKMLVQMWGAADGIRFVVRTDIDVRLREYDKQELTSDYFGKIFNIGTYIQLDSERSVVRQKVTCSGRRKCSGEGTITVTVDPADQSAVHGYITRRTADSAGNPIQPGPDTYTFIVWVDPTKHTHTVDWWGTPGPFPFHTTGAGDGYGMYFDGVRYFEGDRMVGSFDSTTEGTPPLEYVAASWAICREGRSCPDPDPLGEPVSDEERWKAAFPDPK